MFGVKNFDTQPLQPPSLSVVLPTFNGSQTIGAQLDAVLTQRTSFSWELLIVDNGSTDGTAALLQERIDSTDERQPAIRIVSAPDRHNLSYVRNVGVGATSSEKIVFIDDDDIVGEGWLQAISTALDDATFVGSVLEYSRLNRTDNLVGRARFQTERIHDMFGLPVVTGAGHGCQRWVWDAVDGNDESFGATGEDFDFSMRAFKATGQRPVLVENAVYHYRLRDGGKRAFHQARKHGRSHVQLYKRHAPSSVSRRENSIDALGDWWWIITRAPLAAAGVRRENWATKAGRRVGRVSGSIRLRTWLL